MEFFVSNAFISQGIWAKKLNFFTVAIVQTKNHI